MDIGAAFTYVFDDEDWIKKLGIGGGALFLAGIILLPIFPILGYMLQTLKNVRDNQTDPLPEWDNIGDMFMKGLIVFAITLVYNIIPTILLGCPLVIILVVAGQSDPDLSSSLGLVFNCFICFGVIIFTLINFILPASLIRYAQYDTFGSAFQFGEMFSFVRSNIGDYIIAILLSWVASSIAFFGIILCFIGFYFTNFWAILVSANLYGQLARKARSAI